MPRNLRLKTTGFCFTYRKGRAFFNIKKANKGNYLAE
jgi:hypothetical protein